MKPHIKDVSISSSYDCTQMLYECRDNLVVAYGDTPKEAYDECMYRRGKVLEKSRKKSFERYEDAYKKLADK